MSRLHSAAAFGFLAVLVGSLGAAEAALVTKYEYDSVNYLPSSQGWSGPSGLITLINNTTDSALTVDDSSSDVGASIASPAYLPADFSGDWTVTAIVRSDSASGIGEIYFGAGM